MPTQLTPPSSEKNPSTSWALTGIFVIMVFGVLSVARSFFVPVVVATFVALVFSPVRRAMSRQGIPAGTAAGLIMTSLIIVMSVIILLLSNSVQSTLTDAPELIPRALERLQELLGIVEPVMRAGEKIGAITAEMGDANAVSIREQGFLSVLKESTPVLIGQTLFILALASFLIASGDMFYEKLVQDLPTLKDKKRALSIARDTEQQLSIYLLTITAINAVTAILIGTALWALGMPDALLLGVLAFLLNYIPYIGPIFGMALTFMMSLVTFDTLLGALIPPFVYWAINTFEGQFVTPVLVGRRLKLNAVVVFLSVAFWAWIWGLSGMFLATPILIAIKSFVNHTPGHSTLRHILAQREDADKRDSRLVKRILRQPKRTAERDSAGD